jgi:ABC-2 type transport system permease protein
MHRSTVDSAPGNACPDCIASGLPALVSPQVEARVFWRLRRQLTATLLRQTFAQGRLKVTMVLGLSAVLWASLYTLFYQAFAFVDWAIPSPDLRDQAIQNVFGKFFFALMVMLIFSGGILLYGSAFTGRDAKILLTLPTRPERVFLYKFQDAVFMSSWAFLLLGSPMLIAYGQICNAPWYYYATLFPYLLAFVYIPAGLGAILCLAVVYWLPEVRNYVLLAGVAMLLALAVTAIWTITGGAESNLLTPDWFQETLHRLSLTEFRLLPSWWLSAGLLENTRFHWTESLLFLSLMVSNALFVRQMTVWIAAAAYRPAFSRLHGRSMGRKKAVLAWFDDLFMKMLPFLSNEIRLLIVKDLRLFRRDPVQWSQIAIFGGLLGLYFFSAGRYKYDAYWSGWISIVSLLNVSVVGLLLSTFTTRFVFPMISLEGRRFWTLGLLPIRRSTILWSKFIFAVGSSIVPSSLLILLSDLMLRIDPWIAASHQLTCLLLCFGLSGIAVGLGAKMPSLREQSPSRIAAGFGGTLNLVLSALYIMVVVLLTAVPCHVYFASQTGGIPDLLPTTSNLNQWAHFWVVAGMTSSIAVGALTTAIPLIIGFRSFRNAEF